MLIEISSQWLQRAGITEQQLLLEFAIYFFEREIVTLGTASRFAKLHPIEFQRELAKRKIPIHYGQEEFEDDLETLNNL